jgi:hypothetical protein
MSVGWARVQRGVVRRERIAQRANRFDYQRQIVKWLEGLSMMTLRRG